MVRKDFELQFSANVNESTYPLAYMNSRLGVSTDTALSFIDIEEWNTRMSEEVLQKFKSKVMAVL